MPEKSKQSLLQLASNQVFWIFISAALLLNSFIARFIFADNGTNSAICAAAALLVLVPMLLKIIYDDFCHNRVHMNELVLIAVVAGASRGDLLTAGLIAFFMLVGLLIETQSASGAKESLEELTKMTHTLARKIFPNGKEQEVEPNVLIPGDLVRVRPGENIPADGEIVAGTTSIQEANITGESLPVDKTTQAPVFAGTLNLSGLIDIKVSRTGSDTTLGKVKELIVAAERTRPRFIRMIDNYAKYYTPLVLIFAFFLWAVNGHQLDPVVAVLVAACPIALVLSTPSAAVAALSAGARLGILIKNISDIEAFSTITSFVFDKTGTLTTGVLEVTELAPCDTIDSAQLLGITASLEKHSNHPVARAVCRLNERTHVPYLEAKEVKEIAGKGVQGLINNQLVIVGNLTWMEQNGIASGNFPDFSSEETSGMSMLFIAANNRALGWIALEDQPRHDSPACINTLKEHGINSLAIVTGDRKGVAAKVASDLAISTFWGECNPEEKVERVSQLKAHGHKTVFVGDGVNDAPALAASDISIAMGAAGSDLAVETATIALLNNNLNRIPFMLQLARNYKRIMLQNFILGALFIFCGIAAGASNKLGAVPAALLQVVSAIIVIMNSARLVRSGESIQ